MKKAASLLEGRKDFSTYRAASCGAKTAIRTLEQVKVRKTNNQTVITFKSKSFLQKQVRSMVGCLKYVGIEKWDLQKFKDVMNSKQRINCAPPAPAEGLYLKKIVY